MSIGSPSPAKTLCLEDNRHVGPRLFRHRLRRLRPGGAAPTRPRPADAAAVPDAERPPACAATPHLLPSDRLKTRDHVTAGRPPAPRRWGDRPHETAGSQLSAGPRRRACRRRSTRAGGTDDPPQGPPPPGAIARRFAVTRPCDDASGRRGTPRVKSLILLSYHRRRRPRAPSRGRADRLARGPLAAAATPPRVTSTGSPGGAAGGRRPPIWTGYSILHADD